MSKEKDLFFAKVPPQSIDLEKAILGAILIEKRAFDKVNVIIKEECFYLDAHQKIYSAILSLYGKRLPIDMLTVVEELKQKEALEDIGGAFYIAKLTNGVVSAANIESYARIVLQKYIQRELIRVSGEIITDAYSDKTDVFDLLHKADDDIKKINTELIDIKYPQIENIAVKVIEDFDSKVYKAKNNLIDPNTIYTGLDQWDGINGNLFSGLFVVAGRPAMGKGAHMTELCCRMGVNTQVGIINAEMTNEQLLRRIGCNLLSIDNFLFKKNPKLVTEQEQQLLKDAMGEAIQLKLHIDNNRRIDKIKAKIKLWVETKGVKVILADFLTLFKVPEKLERVYTTPQAKIDYVLEAFTSICVDLNIPIILYVQMNREILGRSGTKEPHLGDLKGSGGIEELAYQVSFLHRPEYYDSDSVTDEMGESTKGLMYQIIAKHREGELGRMKFRANLACSKITNWDDNILISPNNIDTLPF